MGLTARDIGLAAAARLRANQCRRTPLGDVAKVEDREISRRDGVVVAVRHVGQRARAVHLARDRAAVLAAHRHAAAQRVAMAVGARNGDGQLGVLALRAEMERADVLAVDIHQRHFIDLDRVAMVMDTEADGLAGPGRGDRQRQDGRHRQREPDQRKRPDALSPRKCWPTVSKWADLPWACWVTVWMSRKRRSNGFFRKIAVEPASCQTNSATSRAWWMA